MMLPILYMSRKMNDKDQRVLKSNCDPLSMSEILGHPCLKKLRDSDKWNIHHNMSTIKSGLNIYRHMVYHIPQFI